MKSNIPIFNPNLHKIYKKQAMIPIAYSDENIRLLRFQKENDGVEQLIKKVKQLTMFTKELNESQEQTNEEMMQQLDSWIQKTNSMITQFDAITKLDTSYSKDILSFESNNFSKCSSDQTLGDFDALMNINESNILKNEEIPSLEQPDVYIRRFLLLDF